VVDLRVLSFGSESPDWLSAFEGAPSAAWFRRSYGRDRGSRHTSALASGGAPEAVPGA